MSNKSNNPEVGGLVYDRHPDSVVLTAKVGIVPTSLVRPYITRTTIYFVPAYAKGIVIEMTMPMHRITDMIL